jgi:hypothetical protein
MKANTQYNVILKRRIKRTELVGWAQSKSPDFNNDTSTKALQYFLDDFKDDLLKSFNEHITFNVESIHIEEVDNDNLNLIFEIEKSIPSFHNAEKKEIMLILVKGAELYSLNYSGFEIDFKE